MPKPCFIAQIYCFLRCCTKSFGYKYLLNYINDYKCLINNLIATILIHSFRGIISAVPSYTRHYTPYPSFAAR